MTPLNKLKLGIQLVIDAQHELADELTEAVAREDFNSEIFKARFDALGEGLDLVDAFLVEQARRVDGMHDAIRKLYSAPRDEKQEYLQ